MDRSHFPLFHSGQVFHQLVCPLTVVLPQIFFNLTTLFSYPVFFSLFNAPLDVVVVAEGFRRQTLASSLGPPQKSHHVDDAGSSPVRAEQSQATLRQKVHIG